MDDRCASFGSTRSGPTAAAQQRPTRWWIDLYRRRASTRSQPGQPRITATPDWGTDHCGTARTPGVRAAISRWTDAGYRSAAHPRRSPGPGCRCASRAQLRRRAVLPSPLRPGPKHQRPARADAAPALHRRLCGLSKWHRDCAQTHSRCRPDRGHDPRRRPWPRRARELLSTAAARAATAHRQPARARNPPQEPGALRQARPGASRHRRTPGGARTVYRAA